MVKFKLTLIGGIISISILFLSIMFELDLFETMIRFLKSLEEYEVDEFIIPIVLFLIFAYIDSSGRHKAQKLELEKNRIYKAMLFSAHHVINNFLNQMNLFKIEAENTPGFNPEVLSLYDEITKDASEQLEALSSITDIDEKAISESVKPK